VSALTVLVAARDEEARIARTVEALRVAFPDAEVVVADDGSRDGTAGAAEAAGARVVRLPRRGKGQALTLAERTCGEGPLLLCDADVEGDLGPLVESGADLAVARFARRVGGGLGLAKGIASRLVRARTGRVLAEPLSGQRALSQRARAAVFPVAAGFGVETRMTVDALRAGLDVQEVEIDLAHRPTRRLRAGATTGTLKLVGIPLWALWRTRSPSAAVLVALSANLLNQLDTRPGRALKAFILGAILVRNTPRGALAVAVLLAPYDHREMTMLGDAGSNALGAVLGLHSVRRFSGPRRLGAIGALALLTVLADRRSLGELIESTPGLKRLDALGRTL